MDNLPPPAWDLLTEREKECALLLARGETNREIATALGVSIKTIDTHRGHIMKKLRCKNNATLVLFLVRDGKVTP
jgi:DNA-binding CsgD family transcriptional regulator